MRDLTQRLMLTSLDLHWRSLVTSDATPARCAAKSYEPVKELG
jgi:hypothetical protein